MPWQTLATVALAMIVGSVAAFAMVLRHSVVEYPYDDDLH